MSLPAYINRKERYVENPKTTTNRSILNGKLTQSNKAYPRIQVSVEFAAKQLFQILLVDIKYRNAKLNNDLDVVPVPFEGN